MLIWALAANPGRKKQLDVFYGEPDDQCASDRIAFWKMLSATLSFELITLKMCKV